MIKSEELSNPSSSLNKAAPDEPVFVLRAQDALAPSIILQWMSLAREAGTLSVERELEARNCVKQMIAWHKSKLPD